MRAQLQSCHRRFLCDRSIPRLFSDDPIAATKPLNNPSTPHRPPPNADDYGATRHAISTDTRAGLGCVKATSLQPEGRGRHLCPGGGGRSLGLSMQASGGSADLPATTRPPQRVQPEATETSITDDQLPIREPAAAEMARSSGWGTATCGGSCPPAIWRVAAARVWTLSRGSPTMACWPLGHPGL
jgi:hypothetical protein